MTFDYFLLIVLTSYDSSSLAHYESQSLPSQLEFLFETLFFSQIYSIIPTMKLQKLYSKVRQALDDYNMITENDKIAIGVSGGKDSLTLLYALSGIRSFYPVPFELVAIAVDLGYEDFDLSPVKALCD